MPAIDVENAWGLDATSYGNHEFDYGIERLLMHQERANFPFLATNIVDAVTGQAPPWVTPSAVFEVNGVKVGVIGAELEDTPELVSAGATAGLRFLDEAPRIKEESERLRSLGVRVQIVVIHQGTSRGQNTIGNAAGAPWEGPILGIADALQDTTVDAMIVGHTHRISNLMRGNILITEGINAGTSYSVLQLLVQGGDVAWAGGATRVAKNLGVAPRADVQAIVDEANAETAVAPQPGHRHAVGRHPARPDPSERVGDGQHGRGRDAGEVSGCRCRVHQLRRPAGRPSFAPPSAAEAAGEITWGEMFAVLPFGNRTVILTLTGAQLQTAFLNGFSPVCNPAIAHGTLPAGLGPEGEPSTATARRRSWTACGRRRPGPRAR